MAINGNFNNRIYSKPNTLPKISTQGLNQSKANENTKVGGRTKTYDIDLTKATSGSGFCWGVLGRLFYNPIFQNFGLNFGINPWTAEDPKNVMQSHYYS